MRGLINMVSAAEGLVRLKEGNRRFALGETNEDIASCSARRCELAGGQNPFAVILGCSDSRVPAEIVFGQGLGDLFVIRVAGNIVAPSQVGSVEYAVETFGTQLVVVVGHTNCGAVTAGVEELLRPMDDHSQNLKSIVSRITPAIQSVVSEEGAEDFPRLVSRAVRANIHSSVEQLSHGSEIIEQLTASGDLLIVGAEYCLESGVVEFF
jgi:carbonic anhydrase